MFCGCRVFLFSLMVSMVMTEQRLGDSAHVGRFVFLCLLFIVANEPRRKWLISIVTSSSEVGVSCLNHSGVW